jgi:hypothetical protein
MIKIKELFKFVNNLKNKTKLLFPEIIFYNPMIMFWKLNWQRFLSRDTCPKKKDKNWKRKD